MNTQYMPRFVAMLEAPEFVDCDVAYWISTRGRKLETLHMLGVLVKNVLGKRFRNLDTINVSTVLKSLDKNMNVKHRSWVLFVDNTDGLEEELCATHTFGAEIVKNKGLVLVTSQNMNCTLSNEQKIFVKPPLGRNSAVKIAWDKRLWDTKLVMPLPEDDGRTIRISFLKRFLNLKPNHLVKRFQYGEAVCAFIERA